MFKMKVMNQAFVEKIYNQYLVGDFPDDERRPLRAMIALMKQGQYDAYGFYQDHELRGYALVYGQGDLFLLDYFAIIKEYRKQHLGSEFLKLLLIQYQDKTLFLEAENPDIAYDETKAKRIQFYQRAGLSIQSTRIYLYFVHYVILDNRLIDRKTLETFYHQLYPDDFYNQYIEFK